MNSAPVSRLLGVLAALSMVVAAGPAGGQSGADPRMAWPAVRAQLDAHWKKTYPNEKVLRIDQKGQTEFYATERRTETDSFWGWVWETRIIETHGAFARQVALVTAERPSGTQARFEVASVFQREGKAWQFKEIRLGKVDEISEAKAGDLPSHAQAADLFKQAWVKNRPDFDLQSVEVLKSEPKQHQDKRWITYKLAIVATGTDKGSREMYQKKYRCTPEDYSSVLNLEGGAWVPDLKMIKNVNESRDCSLAR